jgi:hypothetical protein
VRRVAWFRCVADIEDESIASAWLSTTHQLFELCLQATEETTNGLVKIVDLEGGQSFGLIDAEPAEREDV